jgi:hypothetical protein
MNTEIHNNKAPHLLCKVLTTFIWKCFILTGKNLWQLRNFLNPNFRHMAWHMEWQCSWYTVRTMLENSVHWLNTQIYGHAFKGKRFNSCMFRACQKIFVLQIFYNLCQFIGCQEEFIDLEYFWPCRFNFCFWDYHIIEKCLFHPRNYYNTS